MRAALVMFALALAVRADDADTALAEYRADRLDRAVEIAKPLAEKGDAKAQFVLGEVYRDGRGIGRDLEQAASWYEKAARQGHTGAMVRLAEAYRAGAGVKADDKMAVAWCQKAADAGDVGGLGLLGVSYLQGRGVEKDVKRARALLEKGASLKSGFCFFWLATLEQKPKVVHGLLERAGELGYVPAFTRLGDLLLKENAAAAAVAYRRAADAGDPAGQRQIGLCFLNGWGLKAEPERARTWLRRASASGDKLASAKLRELSRPIFGRILSSRTMDGGTLIEIDKGEMDGVLLRQRGRIPGISERFEIIKVFQKRSHAKVRERLGAVRVARQVVTIER
jgi:TPR repeat protein